MSKTIMLAVDTAHGEPGKHVGAAAVDLIKELAAPDDKVIVLHVHEFALSKFGRTQVDCLEREGEQLVSDIVADLGRSGICTSGVITEADTGHVARAILATAIQENASMLVLGSSSRTDLPWVPFGSVASRLLHISPLPVLIVPMRMGEPGDQAGVAEVTGGVA
jgi:nucleotide-binding universal stress UspA family protein